MYVRPPLYQKTIPQLVTRFKYAGNEEAKTHVDLASIEAHPFGADSIQGVIDIAKKRLCGSKGRRARPIANIGIEIIASTDHGVYLARFEEDILVGYLLMTLKAKAGVVGRHRHEDGRTDFHIVAVNESMSGGALATSLVNPVTGRMNRNIRRVMRAAADLADDRINDYRAVVGLAPIPTMHDIVAAKIEKRNKAREEAQARLAEMDSADDVGPTEDGLHPDDVRAGLELQPTPPWESMTRELYKQVQDKKETSSTWWVFQENRFFLRPEWALKLDDDESVEADELRETLRLANKTLGERDKEKAQGFDRE